MLSYAGGKMTRSPYPITGELPGKDHGLAEEICARVRVKLYRDAITGHDPMSLHTDGGIFRPGDGPTAERWRPKGTAEALTYIGPQAYAVRNGDRTRYVVSGVTEADAPEVFYQLAQLVLDYPRRPSTLERKAFANLKASFPDLIPTTV